MKKSTISDLPKMAKRKILLIIFFILVLFFFYFVYFLSQPKYQKIKVNDIEILVEIANTPQKREKGLSGREYLPEKEGMLFLFPKPDYYSFWMKGMKFPLDFIWILGDEIVEITENVKPEDYQPPKTLTPKVKVDKVLEVNAGFVQKFKIKIGDKIQY